MRVQVPPLPDAYRTIWTLRAWRLLIVWRWQKK